MIEKYEAILNINTEIQIQKPKLAFCNKHLINFFLTSISSIYEAIIDNLNMRDTLMFDVVVYALWIKKTELTNLEVIKEESVYFAAQREFCRG